MNDRRLRIYLDDHLAMTVAEVELIARCSRNNRRSPLGDFLQCLENKVMAQKSVASDLVHRIGGKAIIESRLKNGAAWFAEELGRFKPNHSLLRYSDLSRVIELETLAAVAHERIALWKTFDALASRDTRLEGITFSFFLEQSQQTA